MTKVARRNWDRRRYTIGRRRWPRRASRESGRPGCGRQAGDGLGELHGIAECFGTAQRRRGLNLLEITSHVEIMSGSAEHRCEGLTTMSKERHEIGKLILALRWRFGGYAHSGSRSNLLPKKDRAVRVRFPNDEGKLQPTANGTLSYTSVALPHIPPTVHVRHGQYIGGYLGVSLLSNAVS